MVLMKMHNSPFDLIGRLLKYDGLAIRASAFGSSTDLQPLIDIGILTQARQGSEVTCTECDELHLAPIVVTEVGLRAVCDRIGCQFETDTENVTYQVNAKAAAEWIAVGLGATDEVRRIPGYENAWILGTLREPPHRIALYFATHLGDFASASSLFSVIVSRSRSVDIGLIVADREQHYFRVPDSKIAVVAAREIAMVSDASSLDFDNEELMRLVMPTEVHRPHKAGAPARQRARITPILDDLDKVGFPINRSNECCRTIRDRYEQLHTNLPPVNDTIRNAIAHWEANKRDR